ncbi:MAG: glycosyltransferase [Pseudomonadota bacterium]
MLLALLITFSIARPGLAAIGANIAALILFATFSTLRWAALFRAFRRAPASPHEKEPERWPFYTILAPLHREPEHALRLARTLAALDYPADRREILLICEADDRTTLEALSNHPLPAGVRVVALPNVHPRTKPKACAAAMSLARGDLIVLYDAEDAPAPDQLKKAAARFAAAPPDLACLQTRLCYADARRNWLASQFDIEYGQHFDILLPLLSDLRLPLPLGGAGNHFRRSALVAAGGWDPFNVTEDADLGYRFAALGLRTEILDSRTEELAANALTPWTAQRTRWVKGYLQTLFVHTRRPLDHATASGPTAYIWMLTVLAGTIASYFLYPLLLTLLVGGVLFGWRTPVFDPANPLFAMNVGLAVYGGAAAYMTAFIAARGRRVASGARLLWLLLTIPIYRFWCSAAALAALAEFALRPHHWRKTPHPRSGERPIFA